jgi:hypothetical protein
MAGGFSDSGWQSENGNNFLLPRNTDIYTRTLSKLRRSNGKKKKVVVR